jgi:hypothetical protein
MGTDEIIKSLTSIFEKGKIKKPHCEELQDLLEELNRKRKKIEARIELESSKKKRKKLKIELKIVNVQLRKGYDKLESLKKCK